MNLLSLSPEVAMVKPLACYQLALTFANGEQGVFDCAEYLDHGVFQELKDTRYFNMVKADQGTVVWPHGQDFSPDTLYLDSQKESRSE